MVFQYIFPPIAGNPQTVPYAALVPYALVTDRWYIIFWVRYSPYTVVVTTYHSQEIRIHYCWTTLLEILSDAGKLPADFEYKEHAKVFGSDEAISRWSDESGNNVSGCPSTMQSKSFKQMIALLEDLAQNDPGLNVFIVTARPDRVTAEPDEFENILSKIRKANKMTQVMFTEYFGVNPTGQVKRNYDYLLGKKEVSKSSSNTNPMKDHPRDSWGEVAEERIDENAVDRKEELIAGEGEVTTVVREAVKHGKLLEDQNKSRVHEVTLARKEAQQKGKSPKQSADEILKKLEVEADVISTGEALGGGKLDVLYSRWSNGKKGVNRFTDEGVHCSQAASCMELRSDEEVLEKLGVAVKGRLIIIMDSYVNRTEVNDGLSLVLRLVLDGLVNAVYVERYNRINCMVFKEICELMKVPIVAKDCLGLKIDDNMTTEKSRAELNRAAKKVLVKQNEEEAEAVLAGTPFAGLVFKELKCFSAQKISSYLIEGLENMTFGESGALERRRLNHEEYQRNKQAKDGHTNEDENKYDSDVDDSDSDEE